MDSDTTRRSWLFPPRRGRWDGLDLALLDPSDADDREILIKAEHPELARAIQRSQSEIVLDGQPMSPTLHLTIHQIVANQLWDDDPPEAWETARRLQKLEYDRHEILHMLGSAVSHELWSSLQGQPFDPDRYTTNLQALPESWEAQRQGQR